MDYLMTAVMTELMFTLSPTQTRPAVIVATYSSSMARITTSRVMAESQMSMGGSCGGESRQEERGALSCVSHAERCEGKSSEDMLVIACPSEACEE